MVCALVLKFSEIKFKKCTYTCFQLDYLPHCSWLLLHRALFCLRIFHDTAVYMHKPSALTGANLMENVDICADRVYQVLFPPMNESLGSMPEISVLILHLYLHSLA